MSGYLTRIPDVGITRKVPYEGGPGVWTVDWSIYSLTPEQARQLVAEVLNAADMADELNQKIQGDQ